MCTLVYSRINQELMNAVLCRATEAGPRFCRKLLYQVFKDSLGGGTKGLKLCDSSSVDVPGCHIVMLIQLFFFFNSLADQLNLVQRQRDIFKCSKSLKLAHPLKTLSLESMGQIEAIKLFKCLDFKIKAKVPPAWHFGAK